MNSDPQTVDVSIVIPLHDEEASIDELVRDLLFALAERLVRTYHESQGKVPYAIKSTLNLPPDDAQNEAPRGTGPFGRRPY